MLIIEAIINPNNAIMHKLPTLVRSLFVKYPYALIAANVPEQIKKVLAIDPSVYIRKMTDSVIPLRIAYAKNVIIAVIADIFFTKPANNPTIITSPMSSPIKTGKFSTNISVKKGVYATMTDTIPVVAKAADIHA